MIYSDEELIERAMKRYFREHGDIADQPARDACEITDGRVILSNIRGPLAMYQIKGTGLGVRLVKVNEGDAPAERAVRK